MKSIGRKSQRNWLQYAVVLLLVILSAGFLTQSGSRSAEAGRQADAALRPPRLVSDYDVVSLPVLTRELAAGESFEKAEIVSIKWPKQYLAGSVVSEIEQLKGKRSSLRLAAFSPIPSSALKERTAAENQVVQRIPDGMRAVSIRVDSESAVEGWARPGSRVDVIVLYEHASGRKQVEAKVIAENIEVLSAGGIQRSTIGMETQAPRTVTLLVSQRDTLAIKTASNLGRLTLSLRGSSDSSPAFERNMSRAQLIGDTILKPETDTAFRGLATGPDGERYVLDNRNQWIKRLPQRARGALARPQNITGQQLDGSSS